MKSLPGSIVLFTPIIFATALAAVEYPDLRYFEAYLESGNVGPHTDFFDYVPDLSEFFIDNSIKSICYSGFDYLQWVSDQAKFYVPEISVRFFRDKNRPSWMLYNGTDYEDYIGAFQGVNRCSNLSDPNSEQVSSLRYAGSSIGLNDIYYNLYENEGFGGLELKGNTNAETIGTLDLKVSSLFITGQSPWTFFTGQSYTGLGLCVYPNFHQTGENGIDIDYGFIYTLNYTQLPDNSIRSVARGCLTAENVWMAPGDGMPRPLDHGLPTST